MHRRMIAIRRQKVTDLPPAETIEAWKQRADKPLHVRMAFCLSLLYVHGVITDADKSRAFRRLGKMVQQADRDNAADA